MILSFLDTFETRLGLNINPFNLILPLPHHIRVSCLLIALNLNPIPTFSPFKISTNLLDVFWMMPAYCWLFYLLTLIIVDDFMNPPLSSIFTTHHRLIKLFFYLISFPDFCQSIISLDILHIWLLHCLNN